jgi:RNA polymerase sigma-70 factor (ECF subfamily)
MEVRQPLETLRYSAPAQGGSLGIVDSEPVVYCVVPEELGDEFHERLREFFADYPEVQLVVDRRAAERRGPDSRREAEKVVSFEERRRVRAIEGRRVEERRAVLVATEPQPLPAELEPVGDRIGFFERLEPSALAREDADTARLIARLQTGEEGLFGELYLRYFDRVYTYLRIALQDADEAEDATQDVFIRTLQSIERYERRESPFRAWLFRIARNCAVTRVRKRGRYTLSAPADLATRREATHARTEQEALGTIDDAELVRLIERLPMGQRHVIVLRYMLDLSYRDIAVTLGRSPDAVRQQHHRALEILRRSFMPPTEHELGKQVGHVHRQPMRRAPHVSPVLRARRQFA